MLFLILELNFEEFFNYLPVTAINNLLYVCRFTRAKILRSINFVFHLASSFSSQKRWQNILATSLKDIFNSIMSISTLGGKWFINCNVPKIFQNLRLNIIRHLTFPSIILHFIKCIRSCDKAPNYCILCSRIEGEKWSSFESSYEGLDLFKTYCSLFESSMVLDLDVFMSKADEYFKYFRLNSKKCSFYQEFRYVDNFFSVFSSHLIRIFLSLTSSSLGDLCMFKSDEYKLLDVIVTEEVFLLTRFWHEINIEYFYEFFDKFKYINRSYCFNIKKDKPEFGPYIQSAFDITLETILM